MGVFTYTTADIISPVDPARLFQALSIDNHNMLPKVIPDFVHSIEVLEGDPTSVGCVKQINLPQVFTLNARPSRFLKTRIDEIDASKFYIKYTTFEGDVLGDSLECVVYETTYEPENGGTRYKTIAHYHTKGDYVKPEVEITFAKEATKMIIKAVEDYLIANPQVYATTDQ